MTVSRHASFRRVHESKKDGRFVFILCSTVVMCLAGAYGALRYDVTETTKAIVVGLCVLSAALCLWPFLATRYTIGRSELTVRCGPFWWKVPLRAIKSVTPTRNLQSSAALSVDRLHVKYEGSRSCLYISPRDKNAFMRDLVAACPHLRYDGERVVRAEKNPS